MASKDIRYGIKKTLDLPLDEADRKIREALSGEGFGILTEIDMKETLKKKLDVDFRPYRILGACNPPLAHQAMSQEIEFGLLLPCNVVVYEGDEPNTSVVSVIDPVVQLGVTGKEELVPLAEEVRDRMTRALESVG